jgi:hypothetical protein
MLGAKGWDDDCDARTTPPVIVWVVDHRNRLLSAMQINASWLVSGWLWLFGIAVVADRRRWLGSLALYRTLYETGTAMATENSCSDSESRSR